MVVDGEGNASAGADGPGEPSEQQSDSPVAKLRRSVLEHLVEYWYSQDETLRLARQWTRYEDASAKARATAASAFESADGDFQSGLEAATSAVEAMEGLTQDQRAYAVSAAIRSNNPSPHPPDGYATAALNSVRQKRKDMGLLAAQLLTLVADFELFILRVTSAWLTFDSTHLGDKSKTLTFRELEKYDSVDEIREPILHTFLEDHMRKSASGWFDELSKMFGGGAKIQGADDFSTLEVFQRRHVFVHHGGIVSRQYLDALKEFKLAVALGDELSVDLDYVKRAGTSLASVAHSIAMCALISSSAESPRDRREVEAESGELTYILLTLGRNQVVDRFVSNYDLNRVKDTFAREQLKVNGWIAKRRLESLSKVISDVEEWDTGAADDRFKLAKLVLLDREAEAIAMAVDMVMQGRLSSYSIAIWPLFENIAESIFQELSRSLADVEVEAEPAHPLAIESQSDDVN